ncbi:MAG: N-acetylmuramoyl-L-alanine amidase [Clostridia bacterium]|nr:N-acetylmuramoyl-L-alanine amidase [Clostridia bacterium]
MSDNKVDIIYSLKISLICIAFCVVIFILCVFFNSITQKEEKTAFAESDIVSVVIDAGHGGRDGGAVSDSGVIEKNLNLAISMTLDDILKLCGINTVMTRENDSLVCDETDPALKGKLKMTDLKNRLNAAEENPNAIFVSIHMNKFSVEKYSGLQVYFSPNNDKSYDLAVSIQNRVTEILQKDNTRKVKKAGSSIFLLDRITSPAVLVECGFLSNREESERLCDSVYQTQLSLVIADCVLTNLNMAGNN